MNMLEFGFTHSRVPIDHLSRSFSKNQSYWSRWSVPCCSGCYSYACAPCHSIQSIQGQIIASYCQLPWVKASITHWSSSFAASARSTQSTIDWTLSSATVELPKRRRPTGIEYYFLFTVVYTVITIIKLTNKLFYYFSFSCKYLDVRWARSTCLFSVCIMYIFWVVYKVFEYIDLCAGMAHYGFLK